MSCWIVFIHVVQGRPGGLLQFFKGEAVKIFLASVLSGIQAMWPNREKSRAWTDRPSHDAVLGASRSNLHQHHHGVYMCGPLQAGLKTELQLIADCVNT